MVVWSSPVPHSMPHSMPHSCQELIHPWTDSCFHFSKATAFYSFRETLKAYASLYLVTAIIRRRLSLRQLLFEYVPDVVRSSVFLSWSGTGCFAFTCLLRRLLGRFYFLSVAYLPALLCTATAINLEKRARRRLLAVYVLNVASESVFRMLAARKIIRPIPNGEVIMFSFSMAGFLYFYKKRTELKDVTSAVLSLLIGPAEGGKTKTSGEKDESVGEQHNDNNNIIRQLGSKHPTCKHDLNCLFYSLHGFVRPFVFGYGIRLALGMISSPRILLKPNQLISLLTKSRNVRTGLFLGCFCLTFKAVNCILRWSFNRDATWFGLVGGFVAGFAMLVQPDTSLALYAVWKLVDMLYQRAVDAGLLPSFQGGAEVVYVFVTAFIYHVIILEPHNLRSSYWKMALSMSNNKLNKFNRKVIDQFGTHCSKILA